ncbi:MAG: hypothetical protein ABSC11_15355 [Smithella sp.]
MLKSHDLPLHLDASDWWPNGMMESLLSHHDILLSNNYMENLIESEPFCSIAEELNAFILKHKVVGYHCTKESEKGYFEKCGIRVLDRKNHQNKFLKKFSSQFSVEDLNLLKQAWESYFSIGQDYGRNGKIWFCLAPDQVISYGTKDFFTYFGGEAIYKPIKDYSSITQILRNIGNPVIVKVAIDPNDLHTFSQVPFAINTLSLFHQRQNPKAYIHSREGYLMHDVTPNEIICVTPKDSFFSDSSEIYYNKS